jgi:protein phosphatase
MDTLGTVCRADPELPLATAYNLVDVTDPASQDEAVRWSGLTGRGAEGMVVKPPDFILRGRRGITQPAVKCRGREYLRINRGPDYTTTPKKRPRWATFGLLRSRHHKKPRFWTRAAFR